MGNFSLTGPFLVKYTQTVRKTHFKQKQRGEFQISHFYISGHEVKCVHAPSGCQG